MIERDLKPGWKVWRFDQMATNVNVRIDNPSESGMEHYIGLEHLDADSLKIRRWGTPSDVEATKLMFKTGDIIFGRRRAYQRKLGVAEFDGICSAHAMVLRAKPDVVIPEFLPFFMQSDLFMRRAVEISVGSLSPTINWKTMAAQEFALPPVHEQHRLVDLLLSVETVIDSHEAMASSLEQLVRSRVENFFNSLTGERVAAIGDVATLITKGESPHWQGFSYINEGIPFITSENVLNGRLSLEPAKYIANDFHRKLKRSVIYPGDVLINIVGASIGRACVVPDSIKEANTNQAVAIIRFDDKHVLSGYFLRYFYWPKFQQNFLGKQVNTARANISLANIREAKILLPTLDAQRVLVDECASLEYAKMSALCRKKDGLRLKESILNAASSGGFNVH